MNLTPIQNTRKNSKARHRCDYLAQQFGHVVRAIKNQLTRDFEQAGKDAFKQENPDLEILNKWAMLC